MNFPILTPDERLHLEVYGYVLVPGLFSSGEIETLRDELCRVKDDCLRPASDGVKHRARFAGGSRPPHTLHLREMIQHVPLVLAHAVDPRLVALAEEAVGSEVRLVESYAIINRIDPERVQSGRYEFHRGQDPVSDGYVRDGLYHCSFVKTLTYLTDTDADSGTAVIAGSHKLSLPYNEMIKAAYARPSLIHHVVAKPGDTLIQFESVIHATGLTQNEDQRVVMICGYAGSHFPWWDGEELSPEFIAGMAPEHRVLVGGRPSWERPARKRKLGDAAQR